MRAKKKGAASVAALHMQARNQLKRMERKWELILKLKPITIFMAVIVVGVLDQFYWFRGTGWKGAN